MGITALSKNLHGLLTAGKRNLRAKEGKGGKSVLFPSSCSKADAVLRHKVSSDQIENIYTSVHPILLL